MALMTTIEIAEAGPRDGERMAVEVDVPVTQLEADESNPDSGPRVYEQEYRFDGRVAADGTPIYVKFGKRRLRDG